MEQGQTHRTKAAVEAQRGLGRPLTSAWTALFPLPVRSAHPAPEAVARFHSIYLEGSPAPPALVKERRQGIVEPKNGPPALARRCLDPVAGGLTRLMYSVVEPS